MKKGAAMATSMARRSDSEELLRSRSMILLGDSTELLRACSSSRWAAKLGSARASINAVALYGISAQLTWYREYTQARENPIVRFRGARASVSVTCSMAAWGFQVVFLRCLIRSGTIDLTTSSSTRSRSHCGC